jgi:hypothetical protein
MFLESGAADAQSRRVTTRRLETAAQVVSEASPPTRVFAASHSDSSDSDLQKRPNGSWPFADSVHPPHVHIGDMEFGFQPHKFIIR